MVTTESVMDEHELRVATAMAARYRRDQGEPLLEEVAGIFGVSVASLRKKDRRAVLADARAVVAFLLRERGWTLMEIAGLLERDHSTVHHLIRRVKRSWELQAMAKIDQVAS